MPRSFSCRLYILGGLFISLGLGWVPGHLVPVLFMGLGAGFQCMALAQHLTARKA